MVIHCTSERTRQRRGNHLFALYYFFGNIRRFHLKIRIFLKAISLRGKLNSQEYVSFSRQHMFPFVNFHWLACSTTKLASFALSSLLFNLRLKFTFSIGKQETRHTLNKRNLVRNFQVYISSTFVVNHFKTSHSQ